MISVESSVYLCCSHVRWAPVELPSQFLFELLRVNMSCTILIRSERLSSTFPFLCSSASS